MITKSQKCVRIEELIREYDDPIKREVPSIFDEIMPDEEVEEEYINPYPSHHITFREDYKNREIPAWERRSYKIVDKLREMNISARSFKRMVYEELLVPISKEMSDDLQ